MVLANRYSSRLFNCGCASFTPGTRRFRGRSLGQIRRLCVCSILQTSHYVSSGSLRNQMPFTSLSFIRCTLSASPRLGVGRCRGNGCLLQRTFTNRKCLPSSVVVQRGTTFDSTINRSLISSLGSCTRALCASRSITGTGRGCPCYAPFAGRSLLCHSVFRRCFPKGTG